MMPEGNPFLRVVIGILRVGRGRADGLLCFGANGQAFLTSLAPLLAFPIVGAVIGMASQGVVPALTGLVMYVCALLTPAVVSYELARRWGRADDWPRFAAAFNWCEWILPLLASVLVIPVSIAVGMGIDPHLASLVLFGLLAAYGLWLHWFLARKALSLSNLRSIIMVVVVNAATALVVIVPTIIVGLLT